MFSFFLSSNWYAACPMPGSQGADAMVSMQQWVADTIYDLTGTGHGLVLKSEVWWRVG